MIRIMIKINCNLAIVLNTSLGKAETIVSTSQVVGQPAVFFDRFGGVWVSTRQWEIVTYVDVKQLYDKWSLISKQIDTLNKIIEINFKHINGINIHIVLQV